MGKLWPPLLALLALYLGGRPAPDGWPAGAGAWSLAVASLLLLSVFGLLGLSSGFLQSSVVRFAYLLTRDWERANRFYFHLMRPGVLVHELAHALAAMLVGGKVTSFNVLETKVVATSRGGTQIRLGHVGYTVPGRGNQLGWRLKDAFVGFAPLPLGVALVLLAIAFAGLDWSPGILPALQQALGDWRAWVAMLAIIEVADSMIPSRTDRKNWPAALLVLLLLVAIAFLLLNIAAEQGWRPLPDWMPGLSGAISLLAVVLLAPVAINLVLGAILRLFFAIFHRR